MKRAGGFLVLGVDPKTTDYKVVSIVYGRGNDEISVQPLPNVDIYELNTGAWRSINAEAIENVLLCPSSWASLNGSLHWLGCKNAGGAHEIMVVSMDMSSEEFRMMELPREALPAIPANTPIIRLIKKILPPALALLDMSFRGSLSLFQQEAEAKTRFSIWVMKDYGESRSWTKQFMVDLDVMFGLMVPIVIRVFGFRNSSRILISTYHGLLEIDPVTHTYSKHDFPKGHDLFARAYCVHGEFSSGQTSGRTVRQNCSCSAITCSTPLEH